MNPAGYYDYSKVQDYPSIGQINHIAKEKSVIIVEGYTDVIGLYKSGIKNCVATLGTAFTKFHFNKIKRYTNKIIFCFDGDAAGKSAAWKVDVDVQRGRSGDRS